MEPAAAGREERLRDLVESLTGIRLGDRHLSALPGWIEEAASHSGVSAQRLVQLLTDGGPSHEPVLQPLVHRVVTGETYFFRDEAQIAALRDKVLPELSLLRHGGALRLWSAGCSTGEEAWTLLFLLEEVLGPTHAARCSILGTDLDEASLQRARHARYESRSFRAMEPGARDRWFDPVSDVDETYHAWRVRETWRGRVFFLRHNLVRDPLPDPSRGLVGMDLILCRNVLQYFSPETREAVARRLFRCLSPGGWLLVGHAEYDLRQFQDFESHSVPGAILYRRPLETSLVGAVGSGRGRVLRGDQQGRNGRGRFRATACALADEGCRLADQGREEEARRTLTETLRLDPLHLKARYRLALLLEHREDAEAALEQLRRILVLDPCHLGALTSASQIHARLGRGREAQGYARRARRLVGGREASEILEESAGLTVGDVLLALEGIPAA